MLPGRDGLSITQQMRATPALANIPILMLTARVEDIDRILGLEMGADDYVTKPFNPREVVARVKAILRRGQVITADPAQPVLWTYEYVGLERTVDSHIKNLRRKLETDHHQPQLIETVFGIGYRLNT